MAEIHLSELSTCTDVDNVEQVKCSFGDVQMSTSIFVEYIENVEYNAEQNDIEFTDLSDNRKKL